MANASVLISAAGLGMMLALTAGCKVDEHKNGDNSDVKIATPFGGMSVKTNDMVSEGSLGLTPYPGAAIVKKDKDSGSADVNMSFGSFHLGVKAISYRTDDGPEKVIAFYRKDMAHFGSVVLCDGSKAVGTPERTQDGLGCDKTHPGRIQVNDDEGQQQLKAGSKQHQHIVAIDPQGSGTKIGLISLDLPKSVNDGDNDKD